MGNAVVPVETFLRKKHSNIIWPWGAELDVGVEDKYACFSRDEC